MMKEILNGLLLSFNMYSILPLPYAKWTKENMKYVLAFFPLLGIVEGFLYILLWKLSEYFSFGMFFRASIFSVLSIIYTGGIHFDGYLDTCDALGSNQSREKKLEILKDSHIGAYAVIGGIIYILLYFGAMIEVNNFLQIKLFAVCAVLVRAYSTLALSIMKNAKDEGLAYTFSFASKKQVNIIFLVCIIILSYLVLYLFSFKSVVLILASIGIFMLYLKLANKIFGGLTGDLSGYFFQVCNLILLIILALCFKI